MTKNKKSTSKSFHDRLTVRLTSQQYKQLQKQSKNYQMSMPNIVRILISEQPLPKIVFQNDSQYQDLSEKLFKINHSLEKIYQECFYQRASFQYNLFYQLQRKGLPITSENLAKMTLDSSRNQTIKEYLDFSKKELLPNLKTISHNIYKARKQLNHTFK